MLLVFKKKNTNKFNTILLPLYSAMFLLHNFFVMFSAEHSLFQISCLMKSFQIQYQIPVIEWWLSNCKKRKSRVRSKGDGGSTWSHGGPSPDSYKYLSSLVIALCFTFRNSRSNRMLFRIPGSVMWSVYNHCISTFISYKWLNETNSQSFSYKLFQTTQIFFYWSILLYLLLLLLLLSISLCTFPFIY